jgi:hypothetical protein
MDTASATQKRVVTRRILAVDMNNNDLKEDWLRPHQCISILPGAVSNFKNGLKLLLLKHFALFSTPILGFLLGSTEERAQHSEYHIHLGRLR